MQLKRGLFLILISTLLVCTVHAACNDGILNDDEVNIDCGGSCPACVSSVSQNGITWYFDKDYRVGQFVMGDYWIVGPVTINSVSPGWDGEKHGSMVDPDAGVNAQGYRTGLNMPFNDNLRVRFPLTLSGISSLISTRGLSAVSSGGCHEGIQVAAVLTVVNIPPTDGSFRPPYVTGEKPIFHTSQMRLDLLPRLPPPGPVPTAGYETKMTKVWIDHAYQMGNWGAQIHPTDNMPCYGKDMSVQVSHVANMALLNIPEANEMAIRLTQLGIDFYYNWINNWGRGGGGFGYGRKWPIIFAGLMLDHSDMQNPPLFHPDCPTIYKFPEDDHTYYGLPTPQYPEGKPLWGMVCECGANVDCRDPNGIVDSPTDTGYRTCCSVLSWVGDALAAHIMNAENLWNHDAFFDYIDRWISEPNSWQYEGTHRPDIYGFGGAFIQDMWNTYRDYSVQSCIDQGYYCCPYTCSDPVTSSGCNPEETCCSSPIYCIIQGDIDNNGKVELNDLILIAVNFNSPSTSCPECDLDDSGNIDLPDLITVAIHFGESI